MVKKLKYERTSEGLIFELTYLQLAIREASGLIEAMPPDAIKDALRKTLARAEKAQKSACNHALSMMRASRI